MSLRQFVCVCVGGGRRPLPGLSPPHKLAKTLKNGLAKMGLLFLRI